MLEALPGPRVHREDYGLIAPDRLQRPERPLEGDWVVHVGRAMKGQDGEALGGQSESVEDRRRRRLLPRAEERVDHDVAHEVHALLGDTLAGEVVIRGG